jgi:predicted nucleic acid-binding protein
MPVIGVRELREKTAEIWIPLDTALAEEAARIAAEQRVRGADAVYAAVARRHGATLVTRDQEQLDRLPPTVSAIAPEEALSRLKETPRGD